MEYNFRRKKIARSYWTGYIFLQFIAGCWAHCPWVQTEGMPCNDYEMAFWCTSMRIFAPKLNCKTETIKKFAHIPWTYNLLLLFFLMSNQLPQSVKCCSSQAIQFSFRENEELLNFVEFKNSKLFFIFFMRVAQWLVATCSFKGKHGILLVPHVY